MVNESSTGKKKKKKPDILLRKWHIRSVPDLWLQKTTSIWSRVSYFSASYSPKQPAAANVQRYWRRGTTEAQGALKWEKLYHNSVLQVLFLGVLQSCLHMKKEGKRQVQTFPSLSTITWTRCYDRGRENERGFQRVVQGVVFYYD